MKRSKFSLSNYKLCSLNMGDLVPVGLTEVLPGDTIQQATGVLLRASPLVAPVMHPCRVRVHHWYVPNRIIWEDWEDFITGGPDGNDASVYPTITFSGGSGAATGSLADYLGVPTGVDGIEVSALPFRAYALIWNEWYRDQDLATELTVDITSGADTTTDTDLQKCAWERDYFTISRPWEQKGPAISLPLGTEAPITGLYARGTGGESATSLAHDYWDSAGNNVNPVVGNNNWVDVAAIATQTTGAVGSGNLPQVKADLSNATAASINDLREAFGLQRYEEARARYGSRYTEYLRYLGVRSSDARLQRPEYLGGGRATLQFSEVLQTAPDDATNPVGQLKGHGIAALRSNRYRRFIEEHGWILSTISVRPKTIYMDGLQRHWNRRTKEDFWQKELQHIGQQEILNKEVKAGHATPEGVFGYGDRYDEYRHQWSSISGEFRESTLDFWHFGRQFATDPALNETFIECVPPETPFAITTQDQLYAMVNHSIQARRFVAKTGSSFIY